MSAETIGSIESPGGSGRPKRHRAHGMTALFMLLLLVNLAPVVLLGLMGEWSRDAWEDPTLPPALALGCAAPLVALVGLIGARRGWRIPVLLLPALLTIAWPLFALWVLLNVMCAAV